MRINLRTFCTVFKRLSTSQKREMAATKLPETDSSNFRLINLKNIEKDVYKELLLAARKSLHNGHVIGIPTDTIYGVAASAQSMDGISRLYEIKQRSTANPVAISVANICDIQKWAVVTVRDDILSELLPGPVTLVFERTSALNPELNNYTNLVGVRIPDHNFIRDLAAACDAPLALTSANISSQQSNISAHEFEHLWPFLDMVICDDGDNTCSRLGSTVVDLSVSGKYRIIRPGSALLNTRRILHKYGLSDRNNSETDYSHDTKY